jgi:plastocyanin
MKSITKKMLAATLSVSLLLPSALSVSAHTLDERATVSTPAADLRVTLDRLLAEHAMLAVIAMQKGIDGAADFGAAAGALGENTDDLSAAMASVYGKDAGEAFKGLWAAHIGFFVDYVKATAANDQEARSATLAKLDNYRTDFSTFLAGANPNLEASALANGLQMHVNQLVWAFDSYVGKDYDKAYDSIHEAYTHMFHTGAALSHAIVAQFPKQFHGTNTSTPAADLRVTLNQLLAEHALLAVVAMQKGIDGSADFGAAAGSLGENTDALSAAIASVYGQDAGEAFKGLWTAHIGFFVDYVKATGANDQEAKDAALAKLDNYRTDFSTFLAGANPNLEASALAEGLQMHVNQLVGAFDSYVAKDYDNAYDRIHEAYTHMFHTGDALAGAIVEQFPQKFENPSSSIMVGLKIGSKQLKVNDKSVALDVAPFLRNDHTFVSLRALSEAIGAEVTWEPKTKTVWVKTGNDVATFFIDKDYMELNGMRKEVGTRVFIKEVRTQVPLRFIAELLGWNVTWGEEDQSITLKKQTAASMNMDTHAMEMVTVNISDFAFSPNEIKVKKGTMISFKNTDTVIHTVTADNGSFDTGNIEPGSSRTITLNQVGEFTYYCIPHPFMKGKIIVTE